MLKRIFVSTILGLTLFSASFDVNVAASTQSNIVADFESNVETDGLDFSGPWYFTMAFEDSVYPASFDKSNTCHIVFPRDELAIDEEGYIVSPHGPADVDKVSVLQFEGFYYYYTLSNDTVTGFLVSNGNECMAYNATFKDVALITDNKIMLPTGDALEYYLTDDAIYFASESDFGKNDIVSKNNNIIIVKSNLENSNGASDFYSIFVEENILENIFEN